MGVLFGKQPSVHRRLGHPPQNCVELCLEGSLHTKGTQDPKGPSLEKGKMGVPWVCLGRSRDLLSGDPFTLAEQGQQKSGFSWPFLSWPLSCSLCICKGQMIPQGLKRRLSNAAAHVLLYDSRDASDTRMHLEPWRHHSHILAGQLCSGRGRLR